MFGRIGTSEILIVLALVLIIFGPKRLPEIGRSIGNGIRELRQASKDLKDSIDVESNNS